MVINPTIEHYQYNLLKNTDNSVLIEMEGWAGKNNFPIVGRLVGVFLEMMAKSINAERVFEFVVAMAILLIGSQKRLVQAAQSFARKPIILIKTKRSNFYVWLIYGQE